MEMNESNRRERRIDMVKRRGNGEGSFRQRSNGTWQASLMIGYTADGKKNMRYFFKKYYSIAGIMLLNVYTLKRNKITSPSFTTYSLPSKPTKPFSLAAAMLPQSNKS